MKKLTLLALLIATLALPAAILAVEEAPGGGEESICRSTLKDRQACQADAGYCIYVSCRLLFTDSYCSTTIISTYDYPNCQAQLDACLAQAGGCDVVY